MRATVHDSGRIGVEADDGSWFFRERFEPRNRVVRHAPDGTVKLIPKGLTTDRVLQAIDNYEPRETGDAWSGGFAPNH